MAQYAALTVANHAGIGWPGVFAIALGIGLLLGLVNGLFVNTMRTSALIVTIATMNVFYGILLTLTRGADIFALPDWFNTGIEFVFHTDEQGAKLAINFQIITVCVVFALTWLLLKRTNIGRQIYAVGGNPEAAQRVGFRVGGINLLVYGFMGALAGLVMVARFNSANAAYGESYLLVAILAAVLGGVSPLGGFGKVSGVILSLLILQLLSTASILLGLSQFITLAMWGAILLLASGGIVFKEWLGNRLLNARAAKHPSRVDPDHQGLKPGTT